MVSPIVLQKQLLGRYHRFVLLCLILLWNPRMTMVVVAASDNELGWSNNDTPRNQFLRRNHKKHGKHEHEENEHEEEEHDEKTEEHDSKTKQQVSQPLSLEKNTTANNTSLAFVISPVATHEDHDEDHDEDEDHDHDEGSPEDSLDELPENGVTIVKGIPTKNTTNQTIVGKEKQKQSETSQIKFETTALVDTTTPVVETTTTTVATTSTTDTHDNNNKPTKSDDLWNDNDDAINSKQSKIDTTIDLWNDDKIHPPTTTNPTTTTQQQENAVMENQEIAKEVRQIQYLSLSGMILAIFAMIFTAYQMSENPDGIYAAMCRFCITVLVCLFRLLLSPCKGFFFGFTNNNRHRNYYGHLPSSTLDYGYRDPSVELQLQ